MAVDSIPILGLIITLSVRLEVMKTWEDVLDDISDLLGSSLVVFDTRQEVQLQFAQIVLCQAELGGVAFKLLGRRCSFDWQPQLVQVGAIYGKEGKTPDADLGRRVEDLSTVEMRRDSQFLYQGPRLRESVYEIIGEIHGYERVNADRR